MFRKTRINKNIIINFIKKIKKNTCFISKMTVLQKDIYFSNY